MTNCSIKFNCKVASPDLVSTNDIDDDGAAAQSQPFCETGDVEGCWGMEDGRLRTHSEHPTLF